MKKTEITKLAKDLKAKVFTEVSDIAGAEGGDGDAMLEDFNCMLDLTGDKIHDGAKGDWPTMILIAKEMQKSAHAVLVKALEQHIKEWQAHLKKTKTPKKANGNGKKGTGKDTKKTETKPLSIPEKIKSRSDDKVTNVLDKLLLKGTNLDELLKIGSKTAKAKGQKQFQNQGEIRAFIRHRKNVIGWKFTEKKDGSIQLKV